MGLSKKNEKSDSFTGMVTIAMPVYERKDFFREALDSALNQTVKCKVIVVDNCSSHDYFEKVCKEKDVTYYRNKTNIGLAANFARGFELAETKYVLNLQDDDLLSPNYIESFLTAVNLHPEIDVFFSDYVMLSSQGEKHHRFMLPFGYMEKGHKIIEYGIKHNLGFPYMSSTIKKSKAPSIEDSKGWVGGFDWIWIYSNANHLSFFGDSNKLYFFRIHDNQIHTKEWAVHALTTPYIYDIILQKKIENPEQKRRISKLVVRNLIFIKSNCKKNELKNVLNSNNKLGEYLRLKLENNLWLKQIFSMPRRLVQLISFGIRFRVWVIRRISFAG